MDARESVGEPLTREKDKMCQNALTMKEIHRLRVIAKHKDGKLLAAILLFFDVEGKYSCLLKVVDKEIWKNTKTKR